MSSAKARSRLASALSLHTKRESEVAHPVMDHVQHDPTKSSTILKKYLKHLPLLVFALPFYIGVYYVLTTVPPTSIKNWLVPSTYLPFQFVLFGGNFFGLSFVLLNTRRGLLLTLLLQTLLFLKLQQVLITPSLVLIILVFFGTIEVCANLITLVTNRHRKSRS